MASFLARALIALAVLFTVPATANAAWLRAETERFVVYGDVPERELRDFALRLENFDAALRFYHGLDAAEPPGRKLDVYYLSNQRDLKRVVPTASERMAGVYIASLQDVFAVAVRVRDQGRENDDVIFHEYVHHFMNQHFPSAYPGWLMEGYAEYFMTADVTDRRFEIGRFNSQRAARLNSGDWLPMLDLLTKRGPDIPDAQRPSYYAQAWLLTHYMLGDPGRKGQLMAYVRALHAGTPALEAWTTATGEDLETLTRKLQTYRAGAIRSVIYTRQAQAAQAVAVTPMPASAEDVLLEGQYLKRGVAKADRPAMLADVRKRAARHPGDRLARLVLARAEVLYGDRAAGEAILDGLLAADPNDLDALRLMATSRLESGDDDKARRKALYAEAAKFLGRAYKLDPNHYQSLYAFAKSRSADPDYPSDNTLNVLRLAVQLAPQVDPLRVYAARAMMRRRLWDEAKVLLTPVANDPHGGATAMTARRLLDQVEQRVAGDKEGEAS